MFTALVVYKQEHDDCNVPQRWSENYELGQWVGRQRRSYRASPQTISPERIDRLNELGFIWDPLDAKWEEMFTALMAYKHKCGDCYVPKKWPENPSLTGWIYNQRMYYNASPRKISPERIDRLNKLGFKWDPLDAKWEVMFSALMAYKQKYGDCKLPSNWSKNPTLRVLGSWVSTQRMSYKAVPQTISEERIDRLNKLGFIWDPLDANWEEMFTPLMAYKQKYGDCNVPQRWSVNPKLGSWVSTQRQNYKQGKLSKERIQRLEALGFEWARRKD